ncbi:aminoacylase [Betaproteobacteria bacterium]|nr:aminoacylase [Betaproteobacteria bacterium]
MQVQTVIRNARIIDGAGTPWFRGDVAVDQGKIAAMGVLQGLEAKETLDAGDKYLMPGFIDAHTHSDFVLLKNPSALFKLRQGVTTQLIGECGYSAAPVTDESVVPYSQYIGFLRAGVEPQWTWRSFKEWLDHLASLPLGTNVRSYVGHATVWMSTLGFTYRTPTPEEMQKMIALVERCMDEGACGMTSGLIYSPGMYCPHEEMKEIMRGLVPKRGVYESHMRNESSSMLDCVKETIDVGEANGIPVQIAHHKACGVKNWGALEKSLKLIDEARARGVDVTFNQYPYDAASTTLRAILPGWVQQGGVDALCERLQSKEVRERLTEEVLQRDCTWDNFYENSNGAEGIILLCFPKNPEIEGKTLAEAAEFYKKSPVETAFDLIAANNGEDTTAYKMMSESDVLLGLAHPAGMVASDTIPAPEKAKSHPRGFGTFPHLLDYYVKQTGALRLEEAVRRISSAPARRMGIMDRGLIAPGLAADLVLVDMDALKDNATYESPQSPPDGIKMVMVNGQIALENGQEKQLGFGTVLR